MALERMDEDPDGWFVASETGRHGDEHALLEIPLALEIR
jgi:hypothetical protein